MIIRREPDREADILMPRPTLPAAILLTTALLTDACHEPARVPDAAASAPATASATGTRTPAPPITPVPTLAGLTFGQPIPAGSAWHADAAQLSDACRTYNSVAFPASYAMVIDGRLVRVSFARGSGFRLPSGIAPGSPEAEVRAAYPGLVAEPHKYAGAPSRYLTSSGVSPQAVGLRFEIGQDGTVDLIHIGLPSALQLVEGCA